VFELKGGWGKKLKKMLCEVAEGFPHPASKHVLLHPAPLPRGARLWPRRCRQVTVIEKIDMKLLSSFCLTQSQKGFLKTKIKGKIQSPPIRPIWLANQIKQSWSWHHRSSECQLPASHTRCRNKRR